jgi:CheY-like chemotaxis protein
VEAHSTSRPLDALRLLEQTHYDLVLVDIEMAGMSGFELVKRLRAMPGYLRTPVIFVTAHNDFEVRAKTIESGGDDVIAKPILPVELAAKAVMHLLKSEMLTIPAPDSLRLEVAPEGRDDRAFESEVAPPEESRSRALSHDSRMSSSRPFETAAQNRSREFNAVKPLDGSEDTAGV